jgi:preprotein translocase subunit SecF
MKPIKEIQQRTSRGYGIVYVIISITVLVMLLGLFSCTVTKGKRYAHTQSDTSATFDEKVAEIQSYHEQADTSVMTDADSLSGTVEVSDIPTIIESDGQSIELTGIAGIKGKVKVKGIAKPKKVDFKIDKQTHTQTNTQTKSKVEAHHDNVVADKEKKITYAWYVYAIPVAIILILIYLAYRWVKKQRNLTKDFTGI